MRSHRPLLILLPLLCLSLPACKGVNTLTGETIVAGFVVEPATPFDLEIGQTRLFTIVALGPDGSPADVALQIDDFQVETTGAASGVTVSLRDDVPGDARMQVVAVGQRPGTVSVRFLADDAFFELVTPNQEYTQFTSVDGEVRTRPVASLAVEPSAAVSFAIGARHEFRVTALDAAGVPVAMTGDRIRMVAVPAGFALVSESSSGSDGAHRTFLLEATTAGSSEVVFGLGALRSTPVDLTVRAAALVPTGAQLVGPYAIAQSSLVSTTCAPNVGLSQPSGIVGTSEAGGFLTLTSTLFFGNVPVRGPYDAGTGAWRGEGDFVYDAGSGNPRRMALNGSWRDEGGTIVFRGRQTDTYGTGASACSVVFDVVYARS